MEETQKRSMSDPTPKSFHRMLLIGTIATVVGTMITAIALVIALSAWRPSDNAFCARGVNLIG